MKYRTLIQNREKVTVLKIKSGILTPPSPDFRYEIHHTIMSIREIEVETIPYLTLGRASPRPPPPPPRARTRPP